MTTGSSQDTIGVMETERHEPPSVSGKLMAVHETEVTPLLGHNFASRTEETPNKGRMSSSAILVTMGVLILIVQCGDQLSEAPLTRLYEAIYCFRFWEQKDPTKILISRTAVGPGALGGVDERWCKVAEVQGKVAMLQGTRQFLECIPSLILSIPVGILADRWGRKPFLLLGLCSFPLKLMWQLFVCWFWQSFSLRIAWFSSLHALLGGGSLVVTALFFVIISDVTNQENRSAVLLRIFSANMAANFVCPPIAAWIMTFDPLLAVVLGITCLTAGVPIYLTVPETLGYEKPAIEPSQGRSDDEQPSSASKIQVKNFLQRCYQPLLESTKYFLQDTRVIPLMFTFIPMLLSLNSSSLLLQYTSTRYSMTFSKTTMLFSIKAGFTIVMFLGIQPWIYHFMTRAGMSGLERDLLLARGSAFLMLAGWFAIGVSPNAVFYTISLLVTTLGNGYPVFIRSFLTGLIDPNKVAELYTIVGLIDTVGLMVGSPLLAWLFECGVQLGGTSIGLPFLTLGLIFSGSLAVLLKIGLSKQELMVGRDVERSTE